MKSLFLVFVSIFTITFGFAQVPEKYQQYLIDFQEVSVDVAMMKENVKDAPMKGLLQQNRNSSKVISLPMPDGSLQQFRVVESPILSPELSLQRPEFKSYTAQGIDDPTATARFNITPAGFYAVISGINGISYIEPMEKSNPEISYITYYDHHIISENENGTCESEEGLNPLVPNMGEQSGFLANSCFQNGANLRTYEMVVTCTGEFYQLNGNNDPAVEAALLARVTQINTVYEKELAISFSIVEYLLNSNPATDDFTDPTNTNTTLTQVENHINNNVTAPSWDIGHGFHEITCGGGCGWAGRAGLGVVCTSNKARGYTYLPNDIPTNITVLLHEVGHMFSCRHTNYGCGSNNNCGRYEPGQGSSIMSTSAGCAGGDFFASRTDYFGIGSLQAIMDFMSTGTLLNNNASCTSSVVSGWSDCSTTSATGNNMPSSDADANSIDGLTIPHSTPFLLVGTGSDPDGLGSLTYSWEQFDTDYGGSALPDNTGGSTTAPIFRSFPPMTSNERSCPQLSSVLAGNVTTGTGEILPTVARTLTWRLTVRDNEAGGGGIACDEIALNVSADGPFQITSQNSFTAWTAGNTETVTWDVANTDNALYTCANIDILYSSDGGTTFGTTLASNVPNDGSQTITVPALGTSTGRVKIVCAGGTNIFFDINDVDIVIVSGCNAEGGEIANDASVMAPAGDVSLDLNLFAGVAATLNSGTVDVGDATTNIGVHNGQNSGVCISFNTGPYYEAWGFAVRTTGSFTLTKSTTFSSEILMLYEDTYNAFAGCTNWSNSDAYYDGSFIYTTGSPSTWTLEAGKQYILVTSGFDSGDLGNYTTDFSGTIYTTEAVTPPGYLYTYVIVNTGSGNIIAIDTDSDLSNAVTFPDGTYVVYGLSYLSGANLAAYVGGAFTVLQTAVGNSTVCGDFSTNNVDVNIGMLPIELTKFDGKRANQAVQLNWETATEIDNDFFTLERSVDGRNYEIIATVKGQGTSFGNNFYEYFDEKPATGVNYYRLTQTDFDGRFEVFDKIVAVEFEGVTNAAIRPNPVRGDAFQLVYNASHSGDLNVEIYSITGQLLYNDILKAEKKTNYFDISLSGLSNGVYVVKTSQNNVVENARFVKTE